MQITQSEILGVDDDDGIHVGHVDTRLNDGRGDQHILLVIHEIGNHLLQLFRIHLSMSNGNSYIRYFPFYQCLQLINILDAVIYNKNLPVAAHFEIHRIADDLQVEGMHLRLYRIAVGRWCTNGGEIARSHQRELQRTWNGSGRHGKRIHIDFELFQFLLDRDSKFLFLIDDEQSQILELHILTHQPVRPDEDIDFTFFQLAENILLLFGGACTAQVIYLHREIGQAVTKSVIMLGSQHGGRHQYSRLLPVGSCLECGSYSYLCFSEAYVTADQPIHRSLALHVGLYIAGGLYLVGCILVHE